MLPAAGPVDGKTTVEVIADGVSEPGSHLCLIGTDAVPASLVSSGMLRCVTPPKRESSRVSLRLQIGGAMLSDAVPFVYSPRMYIVSLAPLWGPLHGGTVIDVFGRNFEASNSLVCKFGSHGASVVIARLISSTHLQCVTPSLAGPKLSYVEVSSNGQQFSSSARAFQFGAAVEVNSLVPAIGIPEGGTFVRITGKHLKALPAAAQSPGAPPEACSHFA